MITLHCHLQPQYKYELFHINFTSFQRAGRYELNKLTSLLMCGFRAQLVEHRTGIAEVTGSNPVEALNFFPGLLSPIAELKFTAIITLHFLSCYKIEVEKLPNQLFNSWYHFPDTIAGYYRKTMTC